MSLSPWARAAEHNQKRDRRFAGDGYATDESSQEHANRWVQSKVAVRQIADRGSATRSSFAYCKGPDWEKPPGELRTVLRPTEARSGARVCDPQWLLRDQRMGTSQTSREVERGCGSQSRAPDRPFGSRPYQFGAAPATLAAVQRCFLP